MARFHPPMLAVGSDDAQHPSTHKVFVFEYHEASRRWLKVDSHGCATTDPVHDIAFAPNLGRSELLSALFSCVACSNKYQFRIFTGYHVLAIASKELKIISMKPGGTPQQQLAKKSDESQTTATKYEVRSFLLNIYHLSFFEFTRDTCNF